MRKSLMVVFVMVLVGGCAYDQVRKIVNIESLQYGDARRDVEMLAIKSAYDNEYRRFVAAHSNINTGGRYGYATWLRHEKALLQKYEVIVQSWLKETSSHEEWLLIDKYSPTLEEALVPRKRLLEKIAIWNRICVGRGVFNDQCICFTNGVSAYYDRSDVTEEYKNGFPMKLRIDRDFVWTTRGFDYALAHSDNAFLIDDELKGDCYGSTDALRSVWFLRFKDGVLIDNSNLRNQYWSRKEHIFYFEPKNNRLEVMSIKNGKYVKELFLALWDYEDVSTGKRYYNFGDDKIEILDNSHPGKKTSKQ